METPATKWQPIATAPRDTPILVTGGKVVVSGERGKLYKGSESDFLVPIGLGFYDWEWSFDESELTHWMPMIHAFHLPILDTWLASSVIASVKNTWSALSARLLVVQIFLHLRLRRNWLFQPR